MQCPFCGAPMEKGALNSNKQRLEYINREHGGPIRCYGDLFEDEGEMYLSDEYFHPNRVPAYKCAGCKKILIDYSGNAEKDPAFYEIIPRLKKQHEKVLKKQQKRFDN